MPSFGYGGYGAGGSSLADRIGPSYSDSGYSSGYSPALGYFAGGPYRRPGWVGGNTGYRGGGQRDQEPFPGATGGGAGRDAGGGFVGASRPSGGGGLWAADLGGPARTASPTRAASSGGGFWDMFNPTTRPGGIFGQAISGFLANQGVPANWANTAGSFSNAAPGIFNPFAGLANSILGGIVNRFNNPMTGQNVLSADFRQNMPYDPGVRYPPVYENFTPSGGEQNSGGGGGWFGGGSGWTITETTGSDVQGP